MTAAEWKGVLAASGITVVGLGCVAYATVGLRQPTPEGIWMRVAVAYLIGAACLAFVGWFVVTFVQQKRSDRRFSDPFGDGDANSSARAADGAELARVPSVLFVSPRGIGRCRMAAAYLRALTLGTHRIDTAGVTPDPAPTPVLAQNNAFLVTAVDHVEFDGRTPGQRLTSGLVSRADLVVRIGCPSVRVPSSTPVLDWDVSDPVGADIAVAFGIRDEIKRRVEELAVSLGLANRSLALRDRVIPGQRRVFATGRSAVPYPAARDDDSAWLFAHAEARVLVEVADARGRSDEINARGPRRPDFVVPWVVSAGVAASALARELEWRSVGPSPRHTTAENAVGEVVDWLVASGAIRSFTEAQRLELQRSGREQRRLDDPPENWPTGLAGEYPHVAEARAAEEDLATWEVVPERMLAVYPDLDVEGAAWRREG